MMAMMSLIKVDDPETQSRPLTQALMIMERVRTEDDNEVEEEEDEKEVEEAEMRFVTSITSSASVKLFLLR